MSTKASPKIDKFYAILIAIMLFLAALTIFTFRELFSTIISAYEIEEFSDSELKIDKKRLEEAHKGIFEKEKVPLSVTDEFITVEEESE